MRHTFPILIILAAALLLGVLTHQAEATGCRAVVIRKAAAVKKVAAVQHVKAVVDYPYLQLPYRAYYNDSAQKEYERGLREGRLQATVEFLERRLQRLERGIPGSGTGDSPPRAPEAGDQAGNTPPGGPPPADTPPDNPGLAVLVNRCAKCHDPSQGPVKGGFTLLVDGKPQILDCEQWREVMRRVATTDEAKRMPPAPAKELPGQEVGDVLLFAAFAPVKKAKGGE